MGLKSLKAIDFEKVRKQPSPEDSLKMNLTIGEEILTAILEELKTLNQQVAIVSGHVNIIEANRRDIQARIQSSFDRLQRHQSSPGATGQQSEKSKE